MTNIFFDNWQGIFRILITTILAYILVVIMLRVSGKRTLAKMNAFDFIVTIAFGSILASVILNKKIPLAEGLTAIAVLILLQYCITFISVRSSKFKNFVSSSPTLLFYNGVILQNVLVKERVAIGEIKKAVRAAGFSGFHEIEAIVLETTGDISIISKNHSDNKKAMDDVKNEA